MATVQPVSNTQQVYTNRGKNNTASNVVKGAILGAAGGAAIGKWVMNDAKNSEEVMNQLELKLTQASADATKSEFGTMKALAEGKKFSELTPEVQKAAAEALGFADVKAAGDSTELAAKSNAQMEKLADGMGVKVADVKDDVYIKHAKDKYTKTKPAPADIFELEGTKITGMKKDVQEAYKTAATTAADVRASIIKNSTIKKAGIGALILAIAGFAIGQATKTTPPKSALNTQA